MFELLTLKALTKKLCFWHTLTSSKYLGHGHMSRSSGQGQSQGHRSRKGQMSITKYVRLQVVHLQLTRYEIWPSIGPPALYFATTLAFDAPDGGVPMGRSP